MKRPFVLGGSADALWEGGPESELLLAAVGVTLLLAAVRWHWSHRHGRFFTVVDGQFYRSGAIQPQLLVRRVKKHGIRTVIDLRSGRPAVDRERSALERIGVAHVHLRSKQVPRAETVSAVLAVLDRPESRPVLLHCNHGVRRAALFEAICRMEYQNWSNEQALSALRRRSGFVGFHPGSRGHRFVKEYVPRREQQPAAEAS